jgi:hypothetical protein
MHSLVCVISNLQAAPFWLCAPLADARRFQIRGRHISQVTLTKKCYASIRKKTDRVVILIRLEDYAGRTDLLSTTVAHVEQELGRAVRQ